jgi:hypothetical protein
VVQVTTAFGDEDQAPCLFGLLFEVAAAYGAFVGVEQAAA